MEKNSHHLRVSECLAVIGILGVIVAIVLGVMGDILVHPVDARTKATVKMLEVAVENYRCKFGNYPMGNNARITSALLKSELINRRQYRIQDGCLVDGWGRPLFMRNCDDTVRIASAGENGFFYDDDDITNY